MAEREPIELSDQLRTFLQTQEFTCLSILTDKGTAYILKAPGYEIDHCRGTLPISFEHELYAYPTAPVIRTVIGMHDQPDSSLYFEAFINVADPEQRAEFESLSHQSYILLHFYDEQTRHRLSKLINHLPPRELPMILKHAEDYYRALPPGRFDFDAAKARLIEQHPLDEYGTS